MATTTRLGLYRPIGTVSAPASAGGTVNSFLTLDANAVPFVLGTVFRLFDSGSNKKESTAFTVTGLSSTAGTTTISFTPAAAVVTAVTDLAYIPEITNVITSISNQMGIIEPRAFVMGCTSTTRPASPYTGLLIYETDTGNMMRWSGAAWVYVCNVNQPRGYMGFSTTAAVSPAIAANAESDVIVSVTFTAIAGRCYAVSAGGSYDHVAGNDAPAIARFRYALGPAVVKTDALITTFGADVNDNTTGVTITNDFICEYVPTISGQTTIGYFIARPNTGDAKTIVSTGYQYLVVEDVGV